MAVAELAREGSATFLDVRDVLDEASVGDALVRLEVHDASRVEWSISIPLPEFEPLSYAIDVVRRVMSSARRAAEGRPAGLVAATQQR